MRDWIKHNYRRVFLDMHIDDWNEEFLSRLDPEHLVKTFKEAGANNLVIKAKPHTGLCYWPSTLGRMHKGLKGMDYVGTMTKLCREYDITTTVYYSQVFDNWASDHHPDWRCINADGEDERAMTGRKGTCCPNNPDYRAYVKHNLQELARNYDYDSMFLDMCFWWEVCYCPCCRKRYYEETGEEMPKIVNWADPKFIQFQLHRDRWMNEFVKFSTDAVKEIKPDVTIEHNFSTIQFPWTGAATEGILDACDFAGGDYYGGYLQQTFISKYYNNVTPNKPFEYITSRCDPSLGFQTCTKSYEEMVLHIITALCHNGAFSLCDGINPDGTIDDYVYTDIMKRAFALTAPYEKYVSGDMNTDVAVLFATNSKFNWSDNGQRVRFNMTDNSQFLTDPLKTTGILRDNNIPYNVVGSRNLNRIHDKVLILTNVVHLLDEEMEAIERYVRNGGRLYLSGHLGHKRLHELLGIRYLGMTERNQVYNAPQETTYMAPTDLGRPYFDVFTAHSPLSSSRQAHLVDLVEERDAQVLATVTLPYTKATDSAFASIHSHPPGIATKHPAVLLKQVGKGQILWLASSIECEPPYLTKKVVRNLLQLLCPDYSFYSNAPKDVEILSWNKDDKLYFAAINQQEQPPVSPHYFIHIDVPRKIRKAVLLGTGEELPVEIVDGRSRIALPELQLFHMVQCEI